MYTAPHDPARPLAGRRIVVPRAVAQAAPLAAALADEGAAVVHLPLLQIEFGTGDELRAAIASMPRPDWIVCTSANAVTACVAAGLAPDLGGVRIAAIGSATARALGAADIEVHFLPSEATATVLAAELPPAATALLPLAELAASTLEDGLGQRGFTTTRVTAYRSVLPTIDDAALAEASSTDLILATAPSVVERLVATLGIDAIPEPLICIGPSTAAAATRHGLASVVADPHNDEGLVTAARETLADLR